MLIPSSVFSISSILLLSFNWLFYIFSMPLLKFSLSLSILLPSFLSIFIIIILNSFLW